MNKCFCCARGVHFKHRFYYTDETRGRGLMAYNSTLKLTRHSCTARKHYRSCSFPCCIPRCVHVLTDTSMCETTNHEKQRVVGIHILFAVFNFCANRWLAQLSESFSRSCFLFLPRLSPLRRSSAILPFTNAKAFRLWSRQPFCALKTLSFLFFPLALSFKTFHPASWLFPFNFFSSLPLFSVVYTECLFFLALFLPQLTFRIALPRPEIHNYSHTFVFGNKMDVGVTPFRNINKYLGASPKVTLFSVQ